MIPDFTTYTDEELLAVSTEANKELSRRQQCTENEKIIAQVKAQGYYLEYPTNRNISQLQSTELEVPVRLSFNSRSNDDDLYSNMEVIDYDIPFKHKKEWLELFEDSLPKIDTKSQMAMIQRGKWELTGDWDDNCRATGYMILTLWYNSYSSDEEIGYGLDIEAESEVIFWKTAEGVRYYHPIISLEEPHATLDYFDDKWILRNETNNPPQLIADGSTKFGYTGTIDIEDHQDYLSQIIKVE